MKQEEKFGNDRRQREERTYRSSVGWERIAHDIRVARICGGSMGSPVAGPPITISYIMGLD